MTGHEFLKKLKKLGKQQGITVSHKKEHGKGSHGTVYYDNKRTILKDLKKEIGKGLLGDIYKQLGIKSEDLNA